MEQRKGDSSDLAGLLRHGCCAEGERKEGDGAAGWASLSVPVQGTGSAGERHRLVGLGASKGLWRVGPRSCLRMTALWAWRGGGAGNVRAGADMWGGKRGTAREVTGRGEVAGPRKSGMGRRVGKRGEKVGPRKRAEVRGKGEGEVGRAGFDWARILG